MPRGYRKKHFEDTKITLTKKELVIRTKLSNPDYTLKYISLDVVKCGYGYARKVWSKYVREEVTKRGSPSGLPFNVHAWFYYAEVPTSWISRVLVRESVNRNRQKSWKGQRLSVVFHRRGKVYVYPKLVGWGEELKRFLNTFWDENEVALFMSNMSEQGKKDFAFHTPGVPKKFRINIKGLGTFSTDPTPYPDGTTEFSADLGFEKNIRNIQRSIDVLRKGMVSKDQRTDRLVDSVILLVGRIDLLLEKL